MRKNQRNKIRESKGDRLLQVLTTLLLIGITIIVGYPILYVVSCSFSSNSALNTGKVLLWPVDATVASYKFVFRYKQVWIGYRNTIFYTLAGTAITLFLEVMMAYPLSKNYYQGRKPITTLMIIAMMTSAGLIPSYLLRESLGMVDTVWAVLLGAALGIRNVIILRTAFKSSIPGELFDAARIDGANEFQCLTSIAIPLAKATISVLTLYAAVGHWNEYFNAMIYLHNPNMYPLSLFLRQILTASQTIDAGSVQGSDMLAMLSEGIEGIKYALIVISTVPVLIFYAVVQKYFKTGVMIGSVKG